MAKVKDILVHVSVETAVSRRKCHRSEKHGVAAGNRCLVVKQGLYKRNYCGTCASAILASAEIRLAAIKADMLG